MFDQRVKARRRPILKRADVELPWRSPFLCSLLEFDRALRQVDSGDFDVEAGRPSSFGETVRGGAPPR
jgi:hypothetical protein